MIPNSFELCYPVPGHFSSFIYRSTLQLLLMLATGLKSSRFSRTKPIFTVIVTFTISSGGNVIKWAVNSFIPAFSNSLASWGRPLLNFWVTVDINRLTEEQFELWNWSRVCQ